MEFFSQFAQDRFLLEHFFNGRRGGVFVEIGAGDGEKFSNTLFFERTMDWSGLCVEASAAVLAKLKLSRRAICESASIVNSEGTLELLLKKHSLFHVDYYSINLEGGEFSVLSNLDPGRYAISIITVQHRQESGDIRALMAKKGYDLFARLGECDVFKRREVNPLPRDPAVQQRAMALLRQAWDLQRQGRLEDAERAYREVLTVTPSNPDALHFLGLIEAQRGRLEAGSFLIAQSLAVHPNNPAALFNYAGALRMLKRHAEAVTSYDRILSLKPDNARVLGDRGSALHELGKLNEALDSYERALAIDSSQAATHYNRGNALRDLRKTEAALASYDRALALTPGYAGALFNRATLLHELKRYGEALDGYNRVLAVNPRNFQALMNRGDVLIATERYREALASYEDALLVNPEDADAHNARGHALTRLMQHEEALASFARALFIAPNHIRALVNRATLLVGLTRFEEARGDFERALELEPERPYLKGALFECKIHCCDWRSLEQDRLIIASGLRAGKRVIRPMINISASFAPEDQLRCARIWIDNEFPPSPESLSNAAPYRHEKIRLGYFSAEVGFNPVATQMAAIFESHDKDRFETVLVSFGRDDQNEMRSRIERAFDRIVDIRTMADYESARLLRRMEIDIAVDLAGLTGNCRTGVLAFRPAPLQVNYLGFPSSMAADYIDYIIADEIALPLSDQAHFTEKIVHLPDTLMPNDSGRRIAERTIARSDAGLPDGAFVFCCFNNSFKFTPEMFGIWMRLLLDVENSVLWLPEFNPAAARNLRREAESRGVASERLVFAPFVASPAEHLARLRLADLFLDTLPYNAHATACDALWTGVPVLTCMGQSLASRVAASLLKALDLQELITTTLSDYQATALRVAQTPAEMTAIRTKLKRNRDTAPLFDTARFTRNLEAAYSKMWQRHQEGQPPAHFSLENPKT